jgi:hypothetical protein
MRCPRCGSDNSDGPRTCSRCGLALTPHQHGGGQPGNWGQSAMPGQPGATQGGQSTWVPSASAHTGGDPHPHGHPRPGDRPDEAQPGEQRRPVGPSWSRPSAQANESPPWAESDDAAPWQTPPQHAASQRWATQHPDADHQPPPAPVEPPRPVSRYPWALWRILVVALPVEAVLAAVYAIFALAPRRGVFAQLAADPAEVTPDAATQSDTINLVLFLLAGIGVLIAIGLMVAWLLRARGTTDAAPVSFSPAWWIVTALGFAAVVVALALHANSDPGTIAVGYVFMGAGALLIAIASVWAVPYVRKAGRRAAQAAADAPSTSPSS